MRKTHTRPTLAIAAVLLAGAATAAVVAYPGHGDLLAREMAATVMVKLADGHGSGVRIAPNVFLTAAHVTADEKVFTIRTSDGVDHPADLLWESPTRDVALLRTNDDDRGPVAEIACRPLVLGEAITGIGNPIVVRNFVSHGTISSVDPIADPDSDSPVPHGVPVDMAIAGGMSGGGVFDADGRVVGLMEAVLIQPLGPMSASLTPIGVIIPSSRICDLLGKVPA